MRYQALIEVKDLMVDFPVGGSIFRGVKKYIRAVNGVSFIIRRGSTVGLVGESGSGKTTVGRAIIGLQTITSGTISYEGKLISNLIPSDFLPFRKRIQMIFQDPFNSLNPRMTVSGIVAEPLYIHFPEMSRGGKRDRVVDLLEKVGLGPEHIDRYPHEISCGQRQRIGIARALAVEPEFLICDEPVSALDVSVQAQIINLLQDLQEEFNLTLLFIAHDLAVIQHISEFILVMNDGKIVEQVTAKKIYTDAQHEYTNKLISAVPRIG